MTKWFKITGFLIKIFSKKNVKTVFVLSWNKKRVTSFVYACPLHSYTIFIAWQNGSKLQAFFLRFLTKNSLWMEAICMVNIVCKNCFLVLSWNKKKCYWNCFSLFRATPNQLTIPLNKLLWSKYWFWKNVLLLPL